jgi:hypothetical protein
LAAAAQLHRAGRPIPAAIAEAGFLPFARDRAEIQLQHLGRRCLDWLFDWLLETDLTMKSTGYSERLQLMRLVVQLA